MPIPRRPQPSSRLAAISAYALLQRQTTVSSASRARSPLVSPSREITQAKSGSPRTSPCPHGTQRHTPRHSLTQHRVHISTWSIFLELFLNRYPSFTQPGVATGVYTLSTLFIWPHVRPWGAGKDVEAARQSEQIKAAATRESTLMLRMLARQSSGNRSASCLTHMPRNDSLRSTQRRQLFAGLRSLPVN